MTRARAGGALITGGAGGIGYEIARRLKADGFRVTITDIDHEAGARPRDELQSSSTRAIRRARRICAGPWNAAGRSRCSSTTSGSGSATGAIWEIPIEDFRQTLEANTVSHILMSQLVAPMMIERQSGVIIMIASGAARTGSVGRSPYGIPKWGVLGVTKSLANGLAPWRIRANAVLPGMVAGKRFEGSIALHAEREGISQQKALDRIMPRTRLKRFIKPGEVAAAVSYLASDDTIGITGTFLGVSGGFE